MENKVIEGEVIKEKNIEIKKKNNFFTSKIFLTICSFVVGAGLMFVFITLTTNSNILVRKVTSENVKTTTVEEVSDLKNAINNVYDSAVYIEVTGSRSSSSGSGFVYKTDDNFGYILTNYHVIENGKNYLVTFSDGKEIEASLVSGDEYYDIAVLKVNKESIKGVATLGDSSTLELGDTVFTVGAPLGKEYMGTITKGIVSGINRMVSVKLTSGNYLMEVIQTDASINNGNSGGPICNIKGEVIGITSSKLVGSGVEGMGFAIPINTVNEIIGNIESGTTLARPYLGVQLVDLTNTFALQYYYNIRISSDVEFGAVLSYVEENQPASKSGLQVGDVIIEIDGEKIDDVSHFKYILYKHKVGDKIAVKYYRENKIEETTIELTESTKSE
ncbi:MAG: trypsin-like peptidase domain-containing protein [Bacilli bacterium]|nr:trypsin-like peptidase domain-containing protein [Bacilli bacterium]